MYIFLFYVFGCFFPWSALSKQICSILTGLVLARDYEEGQRLIKDRDFKSLATFFQACFEIGRRYKILNPEKMRDSYGWLHTLTDTLTHRPPLKVLQEGIRFRRRQQQSARGWTYQVFNQAS